MYTILPIHVLEKWCQRVIRSLRGCTYVEYVNSIKKRYKKIG